MKHSIIVDGVTYFREPPDLTKAKLAIDKFEWLKSDILAMLDRAQGLYDNMEAEGLTFGTVEAEGYLRAAKEIKNTLEYVEQGCTEDLG